MATNENGNCIDIVYCIDATGDMTFVFGTIKENVLSLYENFVKQAEQDSNVIKQFRLKVIAFRDFELDSEPVVESEFFKLGEEKDALKKFLDGIKPVGGGDAPESGLEALALAVKSDWTREGSANRHIIIMYTGAAAKPLGSGSDRPAYPADMPKDLNELKALWDGMDGQSKQLLIYAPETSPWTEIAADWDKVNLIKI